MTVQYILHICNQSAWREAKATGEYHAASLASEGFIHFSTPSQILEVANAFYRQMSDLVLLWVDPQLLTAPLRWEPPDLTHLGPSSSALFPHLYGSLNLDAVIRVGEFRTNSDGFFSEIPGPSK